MSIRRSVRVDAPRDPAAQPDDAAKDDDRRHHVGIDEGPKVHLRPIRGRSGAHEDLVEQSNADPKPEPKPMDS